MNDIRQQVFDLLSQTSNITFVSADQEAGGRISLTPGQRVSAEVLLTQSNNRAQVQVGTQRFNLELPMPVRAGQTLEMTFISDDPRATFAIARQGGITPPVSLSDASRLLSLMVMSEQVADPKLRSSLQSISDLLRRASGEAGVLANLMDEALTYGGLAREGVKAAPALPDGFLQQNREQGAQNQPQLTAQGQTPEQARLAAFEANASQILRHLATSSRFVLAEAASPPVVPLPLLPGEEVDAAVVGTLPGGRVFVQVAGSALELNLSRIVQTGDILRLTFIASQPKPLFALPRITEGVPSQLSDAGRWLSVLEHSEGGLSEQQTQVLERLNAVLRSLPIDSPAFTAINDEAVTYQTAMRTRQAGEQAAGMAGGIALPLQQPLVPGNNMVLSDDMAKLLQALITGNRLALLEAIHQQAMPAGFAPGQQLRADVMASLGGGRFMLQVAGQAMEFSLPKGIRPGEALTLFFIGNEPRPTFLMTRFGRPGDSMVSETGRWLSGFLAATSEQVPARETLGILRTMLGEPPHDPTQVSRELQQGLRQSGLFYEAHLARWFGGDYHLEELLREPQGRLSRPLRAEGGPSGALEEGLASVPAKANATEAMEALFRKAGSAGGHEGIVDQRTLGIVREQMSALQSGQIVFNGELFPGQPMQWTVEEREARRGRDGGQERTWETALALELPRLGAVKARVVLEQNRLNIQLHAADGGAAARMETARPRLAEQLEAAGLVAAEIGIRHDAL